MLAPMISLFRPMPASIVAIAVGQVLTSTVKLLGLTAIFTLLRAQVSALVLRFPAALRSEWSKT